MYAQLFQPFQMGMYRWTWTQTNRFAYLPHHGDNPCDSSCCINRRIFCWRGLRSSIFPPLFFLVAIYCYHSCSSKANKCSNLFLTQTYVRDILWSERTYVCWGGSVEEIYTAKRSTTGIRSAYLLIYPFVLLLSVFFRWLQRKPHGPTMFRKRSLFVPVILFGRSL